MLLSCTTVLLFCWLRCFTRQYRCTHELMLNSTCCVHNRTHQHFVERSTHQHFVDKLQKTPKRRCSGVFVYRAIDYGGVFNLICLAPLLQTYHLSRPFSAGLELPATG